VPRQVPLGWQEPIIPLVCAVLVQKWEACGLKKYGVAVHARISRTTPGAIEQQATEPGLEIIGRICYVCGTTLAEVLLEAARRLPTALLLLPWLRLLLPEALLPTASSIMD
jgi:DNA-binding XRE family transcriptional regulator